MNTSGASVTYVTSSKDFDIVVQDVSTGQTLTKDTPCLSGQDDMRSSAYHRGQLEGHHQADHIGSRSDGKQFHHHVGPPVIPSRALYRPGLSGHIHDHAEPVAVTAPPAGIGSPDTWLAFPKHWRFITQGDRSTDTQRAMSAVLDGESSG